MCKQIIPETYVVEDDIVRHERATAQTERNIMHSRRRQIMHIVSRTVCVCVSRHDSDIIPFVFNIWRVVELRDGVGARITAAHTHTLCDINVACCNLHYTGKYITCTGYSQDTEDTETQRNTLWIWQWYIHIFLVCSAHTIIV